MNHVYILNNMLKVILGGLKQIAWVENTSVAISMS